MRRIGHWWEIGRCDVGHEHIATEAVRAWLGKFVAFAPQARVVKPVLLACGPRDSHTLGMEALGALLAQRRRSCQLLGARTPTTTLVTSARQVDPAAVIVVSHSRSGGARPWTRSEPWLRSACRRSMPGMRSSHHPSAKGFPERISATVFVLQRVSWNRCRMCDGWCKVRCQKDGTRHATADIRGGGRRISRGVGLCRDPVLRAEGVVVR